MLTALDIGDHRVAAEVFTLSEDFGRLRQLLDSLTELSKSFDSSPDDERVQNQRLTDQAHETARGIIEVSQKFSSDNEVGVPSELPAYMQTLRGDVKQLLSDLRGKDYCDCRELLNAFVADDGLSQLHKSEITKWEAQYWRRWNSLYDVLGFMQEPTFPECENNEYINDYIQLVPYETRKEGPHSIDAYIKRELICDLVFVEVDYKALFDGFFAGKKSECRALISRFETSFNFVLAKYGATLLQNNGPTQANNPIAYYAAAHVSKVGRKARKNAIKCAVELMSCGRVLNRIQNLSKTDIATFRVTVIEAPSADRIDVSTLIDSFRDTVADRESNLHANTLSIDEKLLAECGINDRWDTEHKLCDRLSDLGHNFAVFADSCFSQAKTHQILAEICDGPESATFSISVDSVLGVECENPETIFTRQKLVSGFSSLDRAGRGNIPEDMQRRLSELSSRAQEHGEGDIQALASTKTAEDSDGDQWRDDGSTPEEFS